jgi:TonB family protein
VAALHGGDYSAAVRPLELLVGRVTERSTQALARRALGFAHYRLGQYEQAEQQFRLAALADPDEPWSWLAAGISALAQNRLSEAEEALARVLFARPDVAMEAWYAVVLVAVQRHDRVTFIQRATSFVDHFPQHSAASRVLYVLFVTAADRGDASEARMWGERLKRSYPRDEVTGQVEPRLSAMGALAPPQSLPPAAAPPAVSGAPPPLSKPERSNVGIEGDFPFTYYLRQLHAKVSERWRRPPLVATEQTSAVIYFEIDREGQIRGDPKVKQSSGNELYDQSALRAVVDSVPFPPLPREYDRSTLRVHFRFDAR